MTTAKTAYRSALALAIATPFILLWMIGAVGVLGADGDRGDVMYIGVFAVVIVGTVIARLRPGGMARVLVAAAVAQSLVAVIAIMAGLHRVPYSSVGEILGFNAFFVALFLASAWLFHRAARERIAASPAPKG